MRLALSLRFRLSMRMLIDYDAILEAFKSKNIILPSSELRSATYKILFPKLR